MLLGRYADLILWELEASPARRPSAKPRHASREAGGLWGWRALARLLRAPRAVCLRAGAGAGAVWTGAPCSMCKSQLEKPIRKANSAARDRTHAVSRAKVERVGSFKENP